MTKWSGSKNSHKKGNNARIATPALSKNKRTFIPSSVFGLSRFHEKEDPAVLQRFTKRKRKKPAECLLESFFIQMIVKMVSAAKQFLKLGICGGDPLHNQPFFGHVPQQLRDFS